jgi:putative nucleotidyltransferase with HDIG domain
MHGHRSLRFSLYAVALAAMAIALLTLSWRVVHPVLDPGVVAMALLVVAAEVLAVALPNQGAVSLGYPISMAAVLVFGPATGGLIAAGGALSSVRPKGELWIPKTIFNMSQLAVSATLAGLVYGYSRTLLAGQPWANVTPVFGHPFSGHDFPAIVIPALALVAVGVFSNFALIGFGARILYGVSLREFWASSLSWMTLTQIALGLVGFLIAQIYASLTLPLHGHPNPWLGVVGLGLFVLPLVLARETYQQFLRLRETYTDAVRSLVTAIEAKDAYTKGHSLRVAELSVAMATDIGFDPQHTARLEIAALLHDLGKVGVSHSILSKPGLLTDEEMQEIRKHPDIGAGILKGVPFLQDVAPWVEAHHERADGRGYGHGLSGQSIPLEARVLAVADSFDAMTSARPYRAPLPEDLAITELRACSGTQFDGLAVESLCRVLRTPIAESEALPSLGIGDTVSGNE